MTSKPPFPSQVDAQFPRDYGKIRGALRKCSIAVVALGQWAAGWPEGAPYGVSKFRSEMAPVAADLSDLAKTGVVAALRSVNYVPLGYKHLACPPAEWRTPFLIDAYNDVLRDLAERTPGVAFVDTSNLTRPLWDLASDWNHPDFAPSDHQAAAILARVCR